MTRKAVVSYPVSATDAEKRTAIFEGLRECAHELGELGVTSGQIATAFEQLANDTETGEFVG